MEKIIFLPGNEESIISNPNFKDAEIINIALWILDTFGHNHPFTTRFFILTGKYREKVYDLLMTLPERDLAFIRAVEELNEIIRATVISSRMLSKAFEKYSPR